MFVMVSGIRAAVLCGICSVVIKDLKQYNGTYCLSSLRICLTLCVKSSVFFREPNFLFSFVHLVTKILQVNAPAGKLILSFGS